MVSKYRSVLVVGVDPETGKQIRKNFYANTKREANRRKEEYRYQLMHGISTYEFQTFNQVAEQWFSSKKEGIVSDSTCDGYESFINVCNKAFGKCAIQSITTPQLDRLLKMMDLKGKEPKIKHRKYNTLSLMK